MCVFVQRAVQSGGQIRPGINDISGLSTTYET